MLNCGTYSFRELAQSTALHLHNGRVELRPLRSAEGKVGMHGDGGGVGDEDVVPRVSETALAHDDLWFEAEVERFCTNYSKVNLITHLVSLGVGRAALGEAYAEAVCGSDDMGFAL